MHHAGIKPMRIRPLPDDEHIIATLSAWHVEEWAALFPSWGEEAAAAELRRCPDAALPVSWIVEDAGGLQGSVSLIATDAEELADIPGPWLASLFVQPSARGHGYGQALVRTLMQALPQHGFRFAHLFTPQHAAFYAGLGWQPLAMRQVQGVPVTVMRYEVA